MTDKDREELSFDEMELHGDVTIRKQAPPKADKPPRRRGGGGGHNALIFVLVLVVVGAGMAIWYYHGKLQALRAQFDKLANENAGTSNSLVSAATSLEEANVQLSRLRPALEKAQNENKELTGQKADLEGKLAKKEDELKKAKKDTSGVRSELNKSKKRVTSLTSERNKLRKEKADAEKAATEKIDGLTADLESQRALLVENQSAWNSERNDLNSKIRKSENELKKVRKSFEEEAQASLQVLKNQSQLEATKKRLEKKVSGLESELSRAKDRVARLENVDFGDMVPYSDQLVPGEVRFREPLPDGIKIPRKLGAVALQVLVTEVGSVEKAFIIPGQPLEAELASALSKSIYKWKFSPPELDRVRVKTWQTVVVRAE